MSRRTWPFSLCALLILAYLLPGCRAKAPMAAQASPAPAAAPPPAWTGARPVSSTDYIGIGSASKSRPDHQEAAKKNALNDLASEISVRVEGNSLLSTLERTGRFEEEFKSNIATSTKELLEGYELVGSYEDAQQYWLYYRLDKAEHARLKAERKQQAIAQATDLHKRALASLRNGDLRSAFDSDMRGLLAMKEYWGGNDLAEVEGRQVPLANELFNSLQRMVSGVRLAVLPERCVLDWGNHFKREMLINAAMDNGTRLAQLPLVITFPGANGPVIERRNTDGDGRARTLVQRVDIAAAMRELLVEVDLQGLVGKENDPALVRSLVASLAAPQVHVPLDVTLPKVFLKLDERNLGVPVQEGQFGLVLKQGLADKGFRTVERATDADLLVELHADTRATGESSGFHTAVLDQSVKVVDRKTNDTIFQSGKQGLKGIHLDTGRAGLDAYKKAAPAFHEDELPALINAILQ